MWTVSESNPGQQDGDVRGPRGHQKERTTEHTPHDFSWALALRGAGLQDVESSVGSLPGNVCTGRNKEPKLNDDLRGTF